MSQESDLSWLSLERERLTSQVESLEQLLHEARNPMLPDGSTITIGEMYTAWQRALTALGRVRVIAEDFLKWDEEEAARAQIKIIDEVLSEKA